MEDKAGRTAASSVADPAGVMGKTQCVAQAPCEGPGERWVQAQEL